MHNYGSRERPFTFHVHISLFTFTFHDSLSLFIVALTLARRPSDNLQAHRHVLLFAYIHHKVSRRRGLEGHVHKNFGTCCTRILVENHGTLQELKDFLVAEGYIGVPHCRRYLLKGPLPLSIAKTL